MLMTSREEWPYPRVTDLSEQNVGGSTDDDESFCDRHDEMDYLMPDCPPYFKSNGSSPAICRERESLRQLDADVLGRRYWDAVIGMSAPVDHATDSTRMIVTTMANGPLWEVSRAAKDEELPNVLRHFLNKRDPRGFCLHIASNERSTTITTSDDDDNEIEVIL